MVKRRKTETIQFKLRMREDLRRRLELAAKRDKISINNVIVQRLEDSFRLSRSEYVFDAMVGSAEGTELMLAIATVLKTAGSDWAESRQKSALVAEAINNAVALLIPLIASAEETAPQQDEKKMNAGELARLALLVRGFDTTNNRELSGGKK